MGKFLKFPEGFYWAAATSSHQVEGNTDNDWSEWEKSPARIAELKARGEDPQFFISGKAVDHYNRYKEDFDIAQKPGHNMHRLSVEWSRIEPEEGKFDFASIQHYVDVVKDLRGRGIEPMVTLWHFTTPKWLAVKGGVLSRQFPELYKRFISTTVDNLKGDVKYWVTFNEPTTVHASKAYLNGEWPPQEKNVFHWLKYRYQVLKAHTLAYREIKSIYEKSAEVLRRSSSSITSHNVAKVFVGAVENNNYVVMHPVLKAIGVDRLFNSFYNHWLWRTTLPYQDFLGLNYYTIKRLPGSYKVLPKQDEATEMNWEIYPEGFYHCITALKKFKKPVIITENGIADTNDQKREKFTHDHIYWLGKAIEDGVDVRGYLYWSLLDNFEWAKGFKPRFGLVEIDYVTQKRTIRPSAWAYAKIIKDNGIEVESSSSS